MVVRENTEGEYSGVGGFAHGGQPSEVALQTAVYTRAGIERTARYAFELARRRPAHKLSSVTKSNASLHASVLWDRVVEDVAADFPDVEWGSILVDAAAARLVLDPGSLDVLVASNLHGDILSDLTGALAGSLGMAPSGNLQLDGSYPSMFEPVHGRPSISSGKADANPVGAVLSAAMMLDELGADRIATVIREGSRAPAHAEAARPMWVAPGRARTLPRRSSTPSGSDASKCGGRPAGVTAVRRAFSRPCTLTAPGRPAPALAAGDPITLQRRAARRRARGGTEADVDAAVSSAVRAFGEKPADSVRALRDPARRRHG